MCPTLERIRKEAEHSGFFDKLHIYDEHRLDASFRKSHKQYFKDYPRGYGYWIWKPYLIYMTLKHEMKQGDFLVYLDAGCEIKTSGKHRFEEYLNLLNQFDLLIYEHDNCYIGQYTKMDMLIHFNVESDASVLQCRQLMSGGILLRKSDFSLSLISTWYHLCEEYKTSLLCDSPSLHPELPEFREHRHDQSFLTLLCIQADKGIMHSHEGKNIKVLEQKEFYSRLPDWSDMADYPFWAKRNKTWKRPSLFERIKQRINKYANYLY